MGVKFSVNKESLERTVVPQGLYQLEVMGFQPKAARNAANGYNMNGRFQIINRVGEDDPELAAKKVQVFNSLNTSFGVGIQDFVHACGLELEEDGSMPGEFDGPSEDKLKYNGPLVGRRFEAEIAISDYNGQQQNTIQSFVCAVPNCSSVNPKIRHSKNLG